MASSKRQRQVGDVLRRTLATYLPYELEVNNIAPITITSVDLSPNLRDATIFYAADKKIDLDSLNQQLKSLAPRLRHTISQNVRLRYTPVISFSADPAIIQGDAIDATLSKIVIDESELAPEFESVG